jgi:hypothetical protein
VAERRRLASVVRVSLGKLQTLNPQQNERKYGTWHELPGGGRLYSYDVIGRSGWRATYVKEVDAEELTVRFYQEVYDAAGTLREVHHKYPVDLGHQQVMGDKP